MMFLLKKFHAKRQSVQQPQKLQVHKSVAEIAAIIGGEIIGDSSVVVSRVQRIEFATQGDISFLSNRKYVKFLNATNASCLIVPKDCPIPYDTKVSSFIVSDNPYSAFVQLLRVFVPEKKFTNGFIHPSSVIDPSSIISPTAYIGAGCVIGESCSIGDSTILIANVTLCDSVSLGDNCSVHPGVVCYHDTEIGNNAIIHAGTVIGSDGFGYDECPDGSFAKVPQVGNVVIGNDVEIGANCTIDRAMVGSTMIGNGVKIDNLVHIAHNVIIGDNTAIAAQTGISGSAKLGKRNRIAGQVGVVGHLEIADDVIVHAQSGVAKSITSSGHYFGSPAKNHGEELKILAALRQLPDLVRQVNELQRKSHD
ncbi:MAG: UDP-3-O-(3-hydroxymyristoyl)glucosamine N-acyltransferase [Ignavibacteriae bacterium]|nr:UDP-3-O-(3-hydroxymyristoyl)glucosamine N-acyltransferase [Ignavibacteriota bacterium]